MPRRCKPPEAGRARRCRAAGAALLLRAAALLALIPPAAAEPWRVASFNAELHRDGPGLLLRDLTRGESPQIDAVVAVIAQARPDILALQGIDWDQDRAALRALAGRLAAAGHGFPHLFAARPNSGLATGQDMDGDGRSGTPADSQGFGAFTGHRGIAVLSRFPILRDEVVDFSALAWADLPGALLPRHPDGRPFPSAAALAAQRLSSTAHWVVPIALPDGGRLTLLTFQAGPPVFDGAEDRNGRRNHDEIRLWQLYLDGALDAAPPAGRFVIAGGANLDPERGEGRHAAIRALLADPRLQDPRPTGPDGDSATVHWPRVGRLRVDYVLPSADWQVAGAGVFWPAPGAAMADTVSRASRHRLVWVDLRAPR